MAYMLGDRTCMESLRKDITDLQGTVIDVFSRVGAVRVPSWKFPNKMSCDLDLVQLLDRYDYVENDPEITQVSHMVLLELVIDRLLLLLQSFDIYTEVINNEGRFTPALSPGPSMSIGLTVRKYWRSMVKLGTVFQKPQSGKRVSIQDNVIMTNKNETSKDPSHLSSSRLQTAPSHLQSHGISSTPRESKPETVKDTRNVGSQTLESALVPCDACAIAQSSLKEVTDAIVSVCKSQNLPTSLTKIQEVLPPGGILSPNEMRYWASEESKDLARIAKHLSELTQLIQPLRNQLEATKVENERLQENMESWENQLQAQREEMQRQAKDNERKLQEKGQQSQEVMDRLERDKEELRKGSVVLEERVSILKEELTMQHCTIRDLELARQRLITEMQNMVRKEEVSALEKKMNDLKVHLDSTQQKVHESEEAVSKERARGENLQIQKESLQAKQKSLLQQLDRLSQECEDLQGSLGDAEEEKANLEEQIEQIKKEEENLKRQLNGQQEMVRILQQEKVALEKSVSEVTRQLTELQGCLQEQKEREKLLISYPDLHPLPEFESKCSGDITEDMEKQLQANSIRISILEEENTKLRVSLHKLEEKSKQGPLQIVPQTRLWTLAPNREQMSPESQLTHTNSRSSMTKNPTPRLNSITITKDSESSSALGQPERKSSRPAVNLLMFPPENSSIAAYARVKQVKGRNRTPSSDRK
ncbi:PREDICTED: coiled-coil domain-containing protein 157 [Nanorana parkeri]|uniref:coiled-coil domain-containing protein 157 n=1 Tax=Nanorana parkeri TaxID=125878 RepID=UPI0008549AF9|nr:PREDICTED: coiled-coil domain-containing protein 157 [Nanorana parkeri]